MRVAVLGIGHMGAAMSRALAGAGFDLVLYNRTLERAEALAGELGATAAATAADAVRDVDVAISMVADEAAVLDLYRGTDGVIAGLRPGAVAADMSTVPPTVVQALADEVRARRAGLLDAPVSGSVSLAETGGLTIMVGGEASDLERARPVFDALAKRVFHIGPLGTGAAMKLAVNTLIFGLNQSIAEGLVLAREAGIDPERAYDVLAASAAGAPFVGYKRAAFLDPDGTPVAFSVRLAEKDLRLITELGHALGVSMPQARTNLDVLRAADEAGRGEADFSAVAGQLRGGGPA